MISYRLSLIHIFKEAIAMADDELMEKYFEGEDFSDEEIKKGLVKGISDGVIRCV